MCNSVTWPEQRETGSVLSNTTQAHDETRNRAERVGVWHSFFFLCVFLITYNFFFWQSSLNRAVTRPPVCVCLFPSHRLASESQHSPSRRKMALLTASLRQHTDEVSCCAFSPSLLATSSGDKTIRVYSTVDFSELPYSPLGGHGYGVHCCRFSSCGSHLISCSTDGTVMVRSAETGELSSVLQHPGRSPLRACALAPDSSLLLAGACDGTVALWEFTSNTLRRYTVRLVVLPTLSWTK